MLLLAVRFGDHAAFGDVSSDGSSDGIFVKKLPVAAEEKGEGLLLVAAVVVTS